jgi:hypothetical protein
VPGVDSNYLGTKHASLSWALIPAFILSASALFLYTFRITWVGWIMVAVALLIAWLFDRRGMTHDLFRDLALIAVGMVIVSTTSVKADISWINFVVVGLVLGLAVLVPYLIMRFVYRDGYGPGGRPLPDAKHQRRIRFPWRIEKRWGFAQWAYLIGIVTAGYFILPFYFIQSGTYLNWPEVSTWDEIGRLFVGVNAVGTWDELFFICTVFALYRRHFPTWQANILQAIIFVSFLWELGYQSWGPLLTIPFALIQGYTFNLTKSLTYVLTVHLIFDLFVFLAIVAARNPEALPIFLITP